MKDNQVSGFYLKYYNKLIIGFVILSFFFDFLDKIEIFYGIDFIKFNRYLKLIFLVLSLIFIALHIQYVFNHLKVVLLLLLTLVLLFLLKNNYSILYINEFTRYSFLFLVFPLLHYTYQKSIASLKQQLYSLFKILIGLNAVVILIGFILSLAVFQTYKYGRFGYNGILLSQGFTPYFYLSATVIFWVFKDKVMLALTIILSIVSGIKGVYFAEFLIISLLVLFNENYHQKMKALMITIIALVFFILLIALFALPVFRDVLASDGFLSMLFSYRLDNLVEIIDKIDAQNFNIFIGGINIQVVRVEMQLFDIFLFFGIIGLIVYFILIFFVYNTKTSTSFKKAYLIACITLSLLSGNLFYIPLSCMLFLLVLISLSDKELPEQPKNTLDY